jgi:hypothetical protein
MGEEKRKSGGIEMRPFFVLMIAAGAAFAQDDIDYFRAEIRGGGGSGKCTVEVEIDGIAEVGLRGQDGQLRTLQGSRAVFRRFVCNQVLPAVPYELRFRGIDGRGRQTLVQTPGGRNSYVVVRLEDPQSGRHGYTFDIEWNGATSNWDNGRGGSGGRRDGGGGRVGKIRDGYDETVETRTAEIRGGGGDGKCTVEVEIDGIAEVEIQGDQARLITLQGAPAVFRRFVCNQVLTRSPNDFRFRGIDGRGRQTLLQEPGRNGVARIRLEDPQSGRHGYTFDIEWRGGSSGFFR